MRYQVFGERRDGVIKVAISAERLDRYIDASLSSEVFDALDHIFFRVVEHNVCSQVPSQALIWVFNLISLPIPRT
jgi:hypothetical protein